MNSSRFSDTLRYPLTVLTNASHSRANASGVSDEKRRFIPFFARPCSLTKSNADTVSQYTSVNWASFMSRAMTLPSPSVTRSTRVHMAGEGMTTSSPVRSNILLAYAMSNSLTSNSSSRRTLSFRACIPSTPRGMPYASYPPYAERTFSASDSSPLTTGRMSTLQSPMLRLIISWYLWRPPAGSTPPERLSS